MALSIEDDRRVKTMTCAGCGDDYEAVGMFIAKDGITYALVNAQCHQHGHGPSPTVWLNVVFGKWDGEDFSDHVSFTVFAHENGAGLGECGHSAEGTPAHLGLALGRAEGLEHPRISELWDLVDFVVTEDPTIAAFLERPSA